MTTLSANSDNLYKSDEGSIKKEDSIDTPNQKETITESSLNITTGTKTETERGVNSASTLNVLQTPESETTLSNEENQSTLESLQLIKDLDLFLVTAPVNWHENQVIRRYFLNKEEGFVSCVYWNNLYFITGTDIVRCIAYKMSHIGRQIIDRKKFEEGIFSDLRALKCGTHAILENSRSQFLKFLHRNQCLRTQKKQKVFFWFSVPHNKLFADVLERDLKRELANQPATTKPISSIFKSFQFDQSQSLIKQLSQHFSNLLGKDVSHLLIKSNNIIPTSLENSMENTQIENGLDTGSVLKLTQQNSNTSKINHQMNITNNNEILDDDFPLDFLDSSNQILNENYITSIQPMESAKNIGQFFTDSQFLTEELQHSQPKSSQIQIFQQLQPQNSGAVISPQFSDPLDGILLNHNQPLISINQYPQQIDSQATHPLLVFSNIQSAKEPVNSIPQNANKHPSISSSFSQFFPIPFQNSQCLTSPSTFLMNNENQISLEQVILSTTNQTNSQGLHSNLRRVSSPLLTNNLAYINIPSSALLPSTSEQTQQESYNGNNVLNTAKDDRKNENVSLSSKSKQNKKENCAEEKENDNINFAKQKEKNVKQESGLLLNEKQQIQQQNQQSDYMMVMPSYNSGNKLNFGIIGGQIFTPGSIGMEYSFDASALNSGMGISPVIGFNNGLLSAIQYQPSKQNMVQMNNNESDDKRKSINENGNYDKSDKNEEYPSSEKLNDSVKNKFSNTFKSVILDESQSKITKPQNSGMHRGSRFLNPTLQRLALAGAFDGSDASSSDEEEDTSLSNGKQE